MQIHIKLSSANNISNDLNGMITSFVTLHKPFGDYKKCQYLKERSQQMLDINHNYVADIWMAGGMQTTEIIKTITDVISNYNF